MDDYITIDDETRYNEVLILEKSKPYPVANKKSKYKSKEGIHIVFPKIVMEKEKYR